MYQMASGESFTDFTGAPRSTGNSCPCHVLESTRGGRRISGWGTYHFIVII